MVRRLPAKPDRGLYALGILNIIYMLGMLPVYVDLLVVDRHTIPYQPVALLMSVLATGIYISSNAAVRRRTRATACRRDDGRAALGARRRGRGGAGAGRRLHAGTFVGLFLSGLAAIVVSL